MSLGVEVNDTDGVRVLLGVATCEAVVEAELDIDSVAENDCEGVRESDAESVWLNVES